MRVGSKVLGLTLFLSISLSFSFSEEEDVACQTSQQCDDMREELGYEKLFVGGELSWRQELGISVYRVGTNYPSKGCFKKGNVAYFGIGGAVSDMSTTELPGARERIQCVSVVSPPTTTSTTTTTTATTTTTTTTTTATDPSCPNNQYRIKVVVRTGPQNTDSGFKLGSGGPGRTWLDNPVGSLPPLTDYADSVCLSNGRYRLRLEAERNGIKRYWVYVNDEEVLRGPAVNSRIKYHIIRVGYKPTLSTREQEWLEGHNSRRQDFHESNGKEFRPLKWSEKLAQQAVESADAIITNNCKYTGSAGGNVGENKSIRRHSRSSIIPEPDLILKNWIDNKVDREYPDNFTMTAAVWMWIGCAESTGMDDEGFFCHATVCQYSRPGNCNVRSFDNWLDAVLDDGSMCGAVCPDSETTWSKAKGKPRPSRQGRRADRAEGRGDADVDAAERGSSRRGRKARRARQETSKSATAAGHRGIVSLVSVSAPADRSVVVRRGASIGAEGGADVRAEPRRGTGRSIVGGGVPSETTFGFVFVSILTTRPHSGAMQVENQKAALWHRALYDGCPGKAAITAISFVSTKKLNDLLRPKFTLLVHSFGKVGPSNGLYKTCCAKWLMDGPLDPLSDYDDWTDEYPVRAGCDGNECERAQQIITLGFDPVNACTTATLSHPLSRFTDYFDMLEEEGKAQQDFANPSMYQLEGYLRPNANSMINSSGFERHLIKIDKSSLKASDAAQPTITLGFDPANACTTATLSHPLSRLTDYFDKLKEEGKAQQDFANPSISGFERHLIKIDIKKSSLKVSDAAQRAKLEVKPPAKKQRTEKSLATKDDADAAQRAKLEGEPPAKKQREEKSLNTKNDEPCNFDNVDVEAEVVAPCVQQVVESKQKGGNARERNDPAAMEPKAAAIPK
ncbi:hypothetical protein THAOC_29961 [Thalassiosira oceanica]|uniref:SCP domain-containing protein n=1 Tax=Thalassiosira oceanica TaxID=159749 RepID=K0RPU7_THAOC|nr:hypothetical protein THAOC_29961 [Thalassiosira oceanica]|eukprot:EJK50926.1 hypothetical protein THAOC_29961 [Thalassiosira oceanica]